MSYGQAKAELERYIEQVEQPLFLLPYNQWATLSETDTLAARIRLQRTGQILGSAYVEIDLAYQATSDNTRIFFRRPGAPHAALLMPPYRPGAPTSSC